MSIYEIIYVAEDCTDYPTGKFFSTLEYAIEYCKSRGFTEEHTIEYFWTTPYACLFNPNNREIYAVVIIERKLVK